MRSASRSRTLSLQRRRSRRACVGAAGLGRIERGAAADLVVLDDNLEITRVLVGGESLVAA